MAKISADPWPRHHVVVAGDQGRQVRRDRQRLGEPGRAQARTGRGGFGHRRVGHHGPGLRRDDRERKPGLQVGLLEAGVHPPRIRCLELGVEVVALVQRVDEPVQTLSGATEVTHGLHRELVRAWGQRQRQPRAGEARRVELDAIQDREPDPVGDQVEVALAGGACGEGTGRGGDELRLGVGNSATREIDLDQVARSLDQPGSMPGLGASQVGGKHEECLHGGHAR
jgi:hypothetical protein